MKLEIIIPNYNGSHLIKKNLESVINSVNKYDSIVTIVDDHSAKEDFNNLEEFVNERKKTFEVPVQLIRNKRNLGFGGAVNRAGLQSVSDFIILLNSDVQPETNFLKNVFSRFNEDQKLFGVGCMDKSIEGENVVLRGRGIGAFKRGLLIHRKGSIDNHNTLWISGGSCIIKTKLFQKLGGFDELYSPFYWEDIDLSYRALKSGYTLFFDNTSIVEHRHEEGAIKKHFSSEKVKRTAYRNQLTFMWKNVTDSKIFMKHVLFLPYHLINTLIHKDTAFVYGFVIALVRLPDIMKKRQELRSQFIKSDNEIISFHNV